MKLVALIAGAVLLVAASGVRAAQKAKPAPPAKAGPKSAGPKMAPKNAAKAGGAPKGGRAVLNNPLNPVERLSQMTPEQRERILEQLPPQRQAQMRQALERFDRLPPAARERISRQVQSLTALPPAQQRTINQAIFSLNHLPEDRKGPVGKELRSLLNLPPEERTAVLASDDFKKRFSPEEQKIVSDLATNLPPDYPLAGRQ